MSALEMSNREERPAFVRFERRPVENKASSLAAGRSVCDDVDFALVTPPYSKDCVEFKVETWINNMKANVRNKRIPQEWMDHWMKSYEAWKNGQEPPLNGIPLKDSTAWTPAEIKNFISLGFRAVEDIAGANDQGLKTLGMGGVAHKKKAMAIVQAAKDHGPLVQQISALEAENSQLKGALKSLQDQVENLASSNHKESMERSTFEPEISADEPKITAADILETKTIYERYEEKFGKKPHHMMKDENIIKALNE